MTEKKEEKEEEEKEGLGLWDDSKIEQLIKDKRDVCLKTIRRQYIAEVERGTICKALELTHWNRKSAAELLQVSYKTLLNRIEEFKLVK